MDTPRKLFPGLASSLASGDVRAAAAMFGADARITIRDGQHDVGTVSARAGLAATIAAFSEIAYAPVIHLDGDDFGDDGVLTGRHRGDFLGCPPTGRRVYLNVHLAGQAAVDGLLTELTVSTSLASLRHQLRGGGDALAVADGLTAEVRHRMWSPRPEDDEGPGLVVPGTAAHVGDIAGAHPRRRPGRRKWPAAVLAGAVVLALLLVGLSLSLLPSMRGADSAGRTPSELSVPGTLQNETPSSTSSQRPTAPSPPSPTVSSSFPTASAPVIVVPTGPPQVQPGRQVVLPADVLFGFDSSQLSPETQNTLNDLAQQIRAAHVTGQIQVNGYTDNLGSAAHGLELSQQRALVVAQALQRALGDSPVTLLPQGFGDADPIADNATEQGRTRNRRVTIVLPATTP